MEKTRKEFGHLWLSSSKHCQVALARVLATFESEESLHPARARRAPKIICVQWAAPLHTGELIVTLYHTPNPHLVGRLEPKVASLF